MTRIATDAYYRHLCEDLGVALIATDEDLNIQSWNSAASLMFGAASEAMIGAPMHSVFPQEDREQAAGLIHQAFNTGEIISFEFSHRDAHGARRELIATFAAILADDGDPIGASACIRDITHRIAIQNELAERRKMASLGELSGSIAHHFNNILGGIITSVDFAAESGDAAMMRRVLRQIGPSLLRASHLVNGLLAFSQRGRHADDLADFSEIVFSLVDGLETELHDSNIDLRSNVPKLPVIPVPRTHVMTILENVARNAVEAMPAGGTLGIDVSLGADKIITQISDTGCGLDAAACERVFEPFWSTKQSGNQTPGQAIGLGLAIAHGLASVLGGSITVTSTPGKGSCFTITLPHHEHPTTIKPRRDQT